MQQGINTLQQTIGELNITDDAKEGIMKFVRLIMGLIQALQEAFPGMSGPEQKKEGAPGDTKPSEAAAGDGGKGTEKPKENVTSPSVSEKKETVSEKDLEAVQNPIKDAEELKVKIDALEQDIDKKDDDMRKQSEEERDAVNKLIKEWENMKQREKDLRSEHERRSTLMTSEKFPEGCIVRGVTLGQTSETDNDITFAFKAEGKDVSMIKQNLQNLLPAELKDRVTLDVGAQTITVKDVPAAFFSSKEPNNALRIHLFEALKKLIVVPKEPGKGKGIFDGPLENSPEVLEQLKDRLNTSINDLKKSLGALDQTKLSPLCRIILNTGEIPFDVRAGKIVFTTKDTEAVKIIGNTIGYKTVEQVGGPAEYKNAQGQKIEFSAQGATIDLDELYNAPGAKSQKDYAEAILAKIEDFKFSLLSDNDLRSKDQIRRINERMESFGPIRDGTNEEWTENPGKKEQIEKFYESLPQDLKDRAFGKFFKDVKVVTDPKGRTLLITTGENEMAFKAGCIAFMRKGEIVRKFNNSGEVLEQIGVVVPSDLTGMLEGLKLRWLVDTKVKASPDDTTFLPKDPSPEGEKKGKEAMGAELATRIEDVRRTLVQEGEESSITKLQDLNGFTEQFITKYGVSALEYVAAALRDFRNVVTKDFQTFRLMDRSIIPYTEKNIFELQQQFGDNILGAEYRRTIDARIEEFEANGFRNDSNLDIAGLNNSISYDFRGSMSDWNLDYLVHQTLEKCPKMKEAIQFEDCEFKVK